MFQFQVIVFVLMLQSSLINILIIKLG